MLPDAAARDGMDACVGSGFQESEISLNGRKERSLLWDCDVGVERHRAVAVRGYFGVVWRFGNQAELEDIMM
jgi:hypothetical protein